MHFPAYSSLIRRAAPMLAVTLTVTLFVLSLMTAGILFYVRGKSIMEYQLRDKLLSTAAAAAMQFSGEHMERIQNTDTMDSSEDLRIVVQKLQNLRDTVTNIRFAYIMRPTSDPYTYEFVADADLALTREELDENGNGKIDVDEEVATPGTPYEWSAFPAMGDALLHPIVDPHVGQDQWGPIISGYAPIRTEDGQAVAFLGLDMDANQFVALSTSIFSPVALLLILLASSSIGALVILVFWKRRLEILTRVETERSGLLRLAFHQLGEPLTIISWSLDELEEDGPPSIQRTVTNIEEGVKRLTNILKTLRSADMVHTGKIEYKREPVRLHSILQKVADEHESKLAVRKQRVTLDLQDDITMELDPKLIAGVLEQLLSNAIDFSPDKSEISIMSRRVGNFAEFSVSDHGCGIPKKDLSKVWSEFGRASNAERVKADGSGLGLYIVRGIVQEAGGAVSIKSIEGEGTTVTIRLPIA